MKVAIQKVQMGKPRGFRDRQEYTKKVMKAVPKHIHPALINYHHLKRCNFKYSKSTERKHTCNRHMWKYSEKRAVYYPL